MAQSNKSVKRTESFRDLARDLDLLFPNGYDEFSTMHQGIKLRAMRIQELEETNGTLQKVGLNPVKH